MVRASRSSWGCPSLKLDSAVGAERRQSSIGPNRRLDRVTLVRPDFEITSLSRDTRRHRDVQAPSPSNSGCMLRWADMENNATRLSAHSLSVMVEDGEFVLARSLDTARLS